VFVLGGGSDVYDEAYRRAGAMCTDQFMTDFCPYAAGIIDVVTQLLVPPTVGETAGSTAATMRGLRAELYKLNVYSGPSGMFKSHVGARFSVSPSDSS
jgi:hypothetical protein